MWGFLKNIWNRLWGNTQETGMPQNEQIPRGLGIAQEQQSPQGLGIAQEQQSPQGLGIVQESQSPQGLGIVQDQQTDRVDGDNKEDSQTSEEILIDREVQTELPQKLDAEVQTERLSEIDEEALNRIPWNLDVKMKEEEVMADEPIARSARIVRGMPRTSCNVNRFASLIESDDTEADTEDANSVGVNTEREESKRSRITATNDIAMEAIKEEIQKDDSQIHSWGILPSGVNQGLRHFCDYWVAQPDRIPTIENARGLCPGTFRYSLDGFNAFTNEAKKVIAQARRNGTCKKSGGKEIFYSPSARDPKKGVIVIKVGGKLQSMMPGTRKSFDGMT